MEDPALAAAEECKSRGNAHFKSGEFELAVEAYSEAIKKQADQCVFWLNRSNAHRQLQRWADAEGDAAEALRLDPANPKAHYARVVCLQCLGRLQDAQAACEVGLSQHSENKALQQLRNELVQAQRENEKARREAEEKAVASQRKGAARRESASSSSSSSSSDGMDYLGRVITKKEPRPITDEELPCLQLCSCAVSGDVDGCKKLLDSGTVKDINWKRPEDGNTALHLAADADHLPVVKLLAASGASPEAVNDFFLRPFNLAKKGGTVEKLLEEITKPLDGERRNALRR